MKGTDRYGERSEVKDPGKRMLAPIVFFGILNILLGIRPGIITGYIEKIAAGLL